MYRDEERDASPVSTQDLVRFANVLFGRLYFEFSLILEVKEKGDHYSLKIAEAVLLVHRNSSKINSQFVDHCGRDISRLSLCTKICRAYPRGDYFKRLYYTTAFILKVILKWSSQQADADLSEGPNIWIDIFQNEFDDEFQFNGAWRGFVSAGIDLVKLQDDYGIIPVDEVIQPDYFTAVFLGVPLINTLPVEPDVVMDDVEAAMEDLNLSPEQEVQPEVGEPHVEEPQVEDPEKSEDDPPAEQVGGNLDLPPGAVGGNLDLPPGAVGGNLNLPPGAVGGHLAERRRRKRRHGEDPSDSDAERDDSLSPSKAKLDRSTTG